MRKQYFDPDWPNFLINTEIHLTSETAFYLASKIFLNFRNRKDFSLDYRRICELGGFEYQEIADYHYNGQLLPRKNLRTPRNNFQFRLVIKEGLPADQKRFVFWHEVGHSFVFERNNKIPLKAEFLRRFAYNPAAHEYFCDCFSSIMILRPESIQEIENGCRDKSGWLNSCSVNEYAQKYQVSSSLIKWVCMDLSQDYWLLHHPAFTFRDSIES